MEEEDNLLNIENPAAIWDTNYGARNSSVSVWDKDMPVPNRGGSNVRGSSKIGESRFDDEFYSNLYTDLEDFRSREQWWIEKAGKGIGKVGKTVLGELAKLPGYIGGGIAAGVNELSGGEDSMEMFVNNEWIKAISELEESIDENLLPVYTRQAVRDGDLMKNVLSVDFWANEGADGLGFMLAMMVPGLALNKLGAGSKMLSAAAKGKHGFGLLSKVDDTARALGLESGAAAIDIGTATVVNTLYEAGAEANSLFNSIEQNEGESNEEFRLRRATAARNVFASNLAILALPNLILNKNILGRLSADATPRVGKATTKSIGDKIKSYSSVAISNIAREGFFEEGMQSTVEEYFKENDMFSAEGILNAYFDSLGKVDTQKAILLGSLFGTGSGIYGKYNKDKVETERKAAIDGLITEGVDLFEKTQSGIYKRDEEGNILKDEKDQPIVDLGSLADLAGAQESIQATEKALQKSYELGDVETYKILQNQLETQLTLSFLTAGEDGITMLQDKLKESKGFVKSTQELNELGENIQLDQRIANIVGNARDLYSNMETYRNYVIPSIKGDEKYLPEFSSKLGNVFIKTRSNLNYLSRRIKELESLKQGEEARLKEIYDAKDEEIETIPLLKSMDKTINEVKEYRDSIKKEFNSLLSKKDIAEKYSKFVESKETVEDTEEKEKKQAQKEAIKEEEQVIADANEQAVKEEQKITAEINEAKEQVNETFTWLDEFFNKSINADKQGKFVTGQSQDPLSKTPQSIVSAKYDKGRNQMLFMSPPEELTDRFEELSKPGTVAVSIWKSNDGETDTYRITYNRGNESFEIPIIKPYNVVNQIDEDAIDDNMVSNADKGYDERINELESKSLQKLVDSEYGGKVKKDVKLVESTDGLITSPSYKEYRESPRDKVGEEVGFQVGNPGTNKLAEEAIEKYFNKDFSDLDFLVNYLPITVTFGDGIYTQLFFKSDQDGSSDLSSSEQTLRRNIIEAVSKGKQLKDIKSKIAFQYPGKVKNEKREESNLPVENSIADLITVKNYDDIEFLYTTKEGQYNNLQKQRDKDFIGKFTKSNNLKGALFIKETAANGKKIPLLLNIRKVSDVEADFIILATDKILNPNTNIGWKNRISSVMDLDNFVNAKMKEELKALDLTAKNATIEQLFNQIIFDGNSINNYYKIGRGMLTFGSNTITYDNFTTRKDEIKNWLTTSKNRNVDVKKLRERQYRKYMIDSKTISTDIVSGENIFQSNTSIFISSNIDMQELPKLTEQPEKKIPKRKEKKRKPSPFNKFQNEIDDITDNGEDSNTIC